MIDPQVASMLGVDEVLIDRGYSNKSIVHLRIGTEWIKVSVDFALLECSKNPHNELGKIITEAAENFKQRLGIESARAEVLNSITATADIGYAIGRDRAGLARPHGANSPAVIHRSPTPEKRLANRFEAIAEELKRFK